MWLFTGRYRELGPATCLIAVFAASLSLVFMVAAARLIRRSSLGGGQVVGICIAAIATAVISADLDFAEQVFIPPGPGSLNRGTALIVASSGTLVGGLAMLLPKNSRRLLLKSLTTGARPRSSPRANASQSRPNGR